MRNARKGHEVMNYYLFKSGKILGPIPKEKLEQLKLSGELLHYTWIIEERNQQWVPVDPMPKENPFQVTEKVLGERVISGSLTLFKNPLVGLVKGIHSFGLELLISAEEAVNTRLNLIKQPIPVDMNLLDETHEKWLNAKMIFQSAEKNQDGILIRFGWASTPVQI